MNPSSTGDGGGARVETGTVTVAIAVRQSNRSRRAARWAVRNLVPHADRVVFLHVVPTISFVPSPSGKKIPVGRIDAGVVEIYDADRKAKCQEEILRQFGSLCRKKKVEVKILDGENPATTIMRYVAESGTGNLVLGCSSYGWIRRLCKKQDMATSILKSPPTCNIYVVSRHKLVIRHANLSAIGGEASNPGIKKISQRKFVQRKQNCLFDQLSFRTLDSVSSQQSPEHSEFPKHHQGTRNSRLSSNNSRVHSPMAASHQASKHRSYLSDDSGAYSEIGAYGQVFRHSYDPSDTSGSHYKVNTYNQPFKHSPVSTDGEISETASTYRGQDEESSNFGVKAYKNYGVLGSLTGSPLLSFNSRIEHDIPEEIAKLRIELQRTIERYNQTCEELVVHKKEAELLKVECSEESKKIKEALEREEIIRKFAEEEKLRRLEAIKKASEAKDLLAKESLHRHKAEVAASKMSVEKLKVVDALFSGGTKCRRYSKKQIEDGTDNFSDINKIGEGGFGNVYKCSLDHTPAAVKIIKQDAFEKKEEFFREVEILSQLHHPHILLLLGVCPENGCLVYEYMENGSLEDHLFCKDGKKPLPWFIRFRIIFEVACGLAFLHGTKPEPIIHRDLKPGNILLDHNFVSKIGDVGLGKLMSEVVPDDITEYRETILAGTLFYMDPEYHRTGTIRPKSDLYALGIIALQLLTARRPNGLVLEVETAIKEQFLSRILDQSVSDWPLVEAEKLANLALQCTRLTCRERPDLETEVMPKLEELCNMANLCFKLSQENVSAPSHYICPILQKVMRDPYIAGDGFTYEYVAIKAWLERHRISPITKRSIPHTNLVPNHTLRTAIADWKSHSSFSIS